MLSSKRIQLLLSAILALSSTVLIVAAYRVSGTTTTTPKVLTAKLVRRHDKIKASLSSDDVASLRAQALPKDERELENILPSHVPIKVKIKTEKERVFKDRQNKHWARDFELEVKNVGSKPIYHLVLLLLFPELEIGNGKILLSLHYGPARLSAFKEKIELPHSTDVPIEPGATYILRIPKGQIEGWEEALVSEQWPSPKKVVLKLEQITFGDGTGLK